MIRAIPTTYRGIRFRFRLEADWASTFDAYEIEWQYEPEGVELPSGARYLPDFYLPKLTTWFEVKGPHGQRLDKTQEFAYAMVHGSPTCDLVEYDCPDHDWHDDWRLTLIGEAAGPGDLAAVRLAASGAPKEAYFVRCLKCGSAQWVEAFHGVHCRVCPDVTLDPGWVICLPSDPYLEPKTRMRRLPR